MDRTVKQEAWTAPRIFNQVCEEYRTALKTGERVTLATKGSGVYMMYVHVNFCKRIVPVYIARTSNLGRRSSEHLCKLATIASRTGAEFNKMVFSRSTADLAHYKLITYLVRNHKTLADVGFIKLSDENTDEAERHYREVFKSAFLGFNQPYIITHRADRLTPELIDLDTYNLRLFYEYGYTELSNAVEDSLAKINPSSYKDVLTRSLALNLWAVDILEQLACRSMPEYSEPRLVFILDEPFPLDGVANLVGVLYSRDTTNVLGKLTYDHITLHPAVTARLGVTSEMINSAKPVTLQEFAAYCQIDPECKLDCFGSQAALQSAVTADPSMLYNWCNTGATLANRFSKMAGVV